MREKRGYRRKEGWGKTEAGAGGGRMNRGRERGQAGSHGVHQPISAHSSHGSCPPGSATYGPRETQGSHSVTRRISGRPSHGSCPSGRSTKGARLEVRMAPPPPISPHSSYGTCPTENSAYGTTGRIRIASPRIFRFTPPTDRVSQGAQPTAPETRFAPAPPISEHR